ncbi:MAG: hypothetical protein WCV72_00370 [Patescibacteria group bacterium]|jgi:uncharacterized integral membrane protein
MKTSYLVGALIITVLLLIIVFQNINNSAAFALFFSFDNVVLAVPIILISGMSVAAGALYTLAIKSAIDKKTEEMHEDLNSQF